MTPTPRPLAKLAGLAATAAAVVGLGQGMRALARRHRLVSELVAPELRSAILSVPLPMTSTWAARLFRRVDMGKMFALPDGVQETVRRAELPGREPVDLHCYEPTGRQRPSGVLYWIHGGGYVIGSAAMGKALGGRVAEELGVLVVSVDYRLAPEHPFPAPLEDCYTGLLWVHQHAEELGLDIDRIAIGGDSAGGGLAACLAQLAHDRADVPVCFQLLVYPMADDRTTLRADHGRTGQVGWSPEANIFGWTCYLGQTPTLDSAPEYAVAARRDDLTGLPPAWIGVGDIDLFHAEDVAYAERLREAGVEVDLVVVPGMPHGADSFSSAAPSMVAFNDAKVEALRRALTR